MGPDGDKKVEAPKVEKPKKTLDYWYHAELYHRDRKITAISGVVECSFAVNCAKEYLDLTGTILKDARVDFDATTTRIVLISLNRLK